MRENNSLMPGLAVLLTGFFLISATFLSSGFALANAGKTAADQSAGSDLKTSTTQEPAAGPPNAAVGSDPRTAAPSCACPQTNQKTARPKFATLDDGLAAASAPGALDDSDELAALASVQHALSSAGDGQAYVWQRANGRLSGMVRPISSFRNDDGQICRHVLVLLTTGRRTQKAESTACRLAGGRWQLGG